MDRKVAPVTECRPLNELSMFFLPCRRILPPRRELCQECRLRLLPLGTADSYEKAEQEDYTSQRYRYEDERDDHWHSTRNLEQQTQHSCIPKLNWTCRLVKLVLKVH